jgi:hypothetical protein
MALSPRQQLSVQLFHQNSPADQPGLFRFSGLLYVNQSALAMLQHTWSLSPHLVHSLRVAFVRSIATGGNEARTQGSLLPSIGIMNTIADSGISEIDLQGYSSFGRSNADVGNRDNTWHIGEEFSYVRANHSFKFGVDFGYRRGWHLNANATALGELEFEPAFTTQLVRNTQGATGPAGEYRRLLGGFPAGDSGNGRCIGFACGPIPGDAVPPILPGHVESHAQPDTELRPLLVSGNASRSPGLGKKRGPWFQPGYRLAHLRGVGTTESQGGIHGPEQLRAPLGSGVEAGISQGDRHPGWRRSLLFRVPLDRGAVLPNRQSPLGGGAAFSNPQTNPVPGYLLGSNIFPPQPSAPLTSNYAANLPPGTLAAGIDPNFRTGYVSQWSFSIQQGLGKSSSVELSYLGSSGHGLVNYTDLSQCRPGSDLFCSPLPGHGRATTCCCGLTAAATRLTKA